MAHWNNPPEREDGDTFDEDCENAPLIRQSMRREVSRRMAEDPLFGMLADLEHSAEGFYLGLDYDDDLDDIDDVGPF